jgi:post-segregation antitoxin (ccd killing protein)
MTTLELTLNLPDELANKAQAAGLLNSEAIEKLLREQLRKQAGEELRVMLNKAGASSAPPMSEDEIQAEIEVYRAERRAQRGTAS